ncbi:hypothetical protein EVA_03075 [gut metagenome]|uniref:Uncharacterized protein n=1 Tax=gut metagenome TaxID=749906 RepID=J9GZR4_9ZZZZ
MQTYYIHVSLTQDISSIGTLFCNVQRKHCLALFVNQCFGTVDIFRLFISQHTAAKGDDVTT